MGFKILRFTQNYKYHEKIGKIRQPITVIWSILDESDFIVKAAHMANLANDTIKRPNERPHPSGVPDLP